ncbi:MAG TPA: SDR family NAD(P)-dependent oxidoreductase [Rhabdochlamydiaceae bacterium]|jgi:hypothetical protein
MKASFELALVTGASTGLGKALCLALASLGIPLILVARDEKKLYELAQSLPVKTHIYSVDLSTPAQREKFLLFLASHAPDLIINNAGSGIYGPALSHPTAQQAQLVALNVQAVLEITLESARILQRAKKRGTIMNISSAAAFFSYPTHCTYAASKSFVNSFSEGLDYELKPHGIRVLCACPGVIGDTEFSARASRGTPHKRSPFWALSAQQVANEVIKQIEKGTPVKIIDWRYQLLIALNRILPKTISMRFLSHSLQSLYTTKMI